ncbi:hypothetical protein AAMO2058_001672100 [Amorphochlora amoebiformis]
MLLYSVMFPCDACGKRIVDFASKYRSCEVSVVFERTWKPNQFQQIAGTSDAVVLKSLRENGIRVLKIQPD